MPKRKRERKRDHMSCDLWFFVCLVSIGLCRIKLVSYQLLGKASSVDIEILIYGGLCRIVGSGVYCGSEMHALRIMKGLLLTLSLSFSILSLIGVQMCHLVLVYHSSIFLIVLIWVLDLCRCSTLLVYLVGFSFFLIKILTLLLYIYIYINCFL